MRTNISIAKAGIARLLTAALGLAIAFTFTCSDDGGGGDDQLLQIALTQGQQSLSSGSNTNNTGGNGTQRSSSSAYNGGTQNRSSSSVGQLVVSGCSCITTTSNALDVHAVTGNPPSVSSYLATATSAAGYGIMASSNTVTWTRVPNGTFTIVISMLKNRELVYYKATGVSITNGAGSVSWSRFSEFK